MNLIDRGRRMRGARTGALVLARRHVNHTLGPTGKE
jgi:hypothetical protein